MICLSTACFGRCSSSTVVWQTWCRYPSYNTQVKRVQVWFVPSSASTSALQNAIQPISDCLHADGRLQAVLTPESKAEHRTYWLENVRRAWTIIYSIGLSVIDVRGKIYSCGAAGLSLQPRRRTGTSSTVEHPAFEQVSHDSGDAVDKVVHVEGAAAQLLVGFLNSSSMLQLINENRKGYEYVEFVNPEILMSIPGVRPPPPPLSRLISAHTGKECC